MGGPRRAGRVPALVAAAALVVAVPLAVFQARPALACSCDRQTPLKEALARSDGAFVGVLVGQAPYAGPVEFMDPEMRVLGHFEVERVVKGEIGWRLEVLHTDNGASCGLELSVGERSGLLVHRGVAVWGSDMCNKAEPDALLAVAADTPVTLRLLGLFKSVMRTAVVGGVVVLAIPLGLAVRRSARRRA
jgi:hypothetical protein